MNSLKKLNILTPLQKLPKNVGDLGKLIVAKGFEKLPKFQWIVQSGHTACNIQLTECKYRWYRVNWKYCWLPIWLFAEDDN